jgi:hypothetical protein
MSRKSLQFTIRQALSEADLKAACGVRATAYGRHLDGAASAWSEPDALDRRPGTAVFVAFDKATGEPVGTLRLASNALAPTQIETALALPDGLADRSIGELTRFAVLPGHDDPMVKLGLMKAGYLYCLAHQVHWMVIGARNAALVRQYRRLGFTDLLAGRAVPLAHAGHLPHRVLAFDVVSAERNWFALRHPFYEFMVRHRHPDIQPFGHVVGQREAVAA